MYDTTSPTDSDPSVLRILRALLPSRRLRLSEALRLAELQADRLLRLRGIRDAPVPIEVISDLPRVRVEYDTDLQRHAASGVSDWDHQHRTWVITVNPEEPETRQRFTVLHEYKHILDHYHPGLCGRLPYRVFGLEPTEYIAEYFAGCVLMPKRWLKAAYFDQRIQRPADLARLFDVSARAIQVRLDQLGLRRASDEPTPGLRYRPQLRRSDRPVRPSAQSAVAVPVPKEAA